jgi:hypothetical protein
LWASLDTKYGFKVVDDLFSLHKLAQLAKKHGPAAFTTDSQKQIVARLIERFGDVPRQATPN